MLLICLVLVQLIASFIVSYERVINFDYCRTPLLLLPDYLSRYPTLAELDRSYTLSIDIIDFLKVGRSRIEGGCSFAGISFTSKSPSCRPLWPEPDYEPLWTPTPTIPLASTPTIPLASMPTSLLSSEQASASAPMPSRSYWIVKNEFSTLHNIDKYYNAVVNCFRVFVFLIMLYFGYVSRLFLYNYAHGYL